MNFGNAVSLTATTVITNSNTEENLVPRLLLTVPLSLLNAILVLGLLLTLLLIALLNTRLARGF